MFLSQYRDTKTIFYLLYNATKVFLSFCDVIYASVLKFKIKMTLVVSLYSKRKCDSFNQSVRRMPVILLYLFCTFIQNMCINISFFLFLAEAGGTMGLFLGGSVLTVLEILDLFCHIFEVRCCRDKKN